MSLLSKHEDLFRHCYEHADRNATYTSPSIQNELASIMCNLIRETICNEIKQARCFSLLVDETKDISKQEQMSVVLCYVKQCNVYERFVGFVHVSQLDAESLCAYILDTLASFDLSLFDCVFQSYDGASIMSGSCTGVQSRIKELAPQAVYIHNAHRLNLVLVDCVETVSRAGEYLPLWKHYVCLWQLRKPMKFSWRNKPSYVLESR